MSADKGDLGIGCDDRTLESEPFSNHPDDIFAFGSPSGSGESQAQIVRRDTELIDHLGDQGFKSLETDDLIVAAPQPRRCLEFSLAVHCDGPCTASTSVNTD